MNIRHYLLRQLIVPAGWWTLLMLCATTAFCQDSLSKVINTVYSGPAANYHPSRIYLAAGIQVATYGASMALLDEAWYKGYARTGFHTFNDDDEWLQMDKAGHIWSAYTEGTASAALFRWSGLPQRKAVLLGAASGWAYQTVIELLDAHSAEWGWSWGDIGANTLGAGLLAGQELLWREQRILFKFSFHHYSYADPQLRTQAYTLFGSTFQERMLKDYNAQTYWLSLNLKSFLPQSNLPAWLNVSVGYGADGMYGGTQNVWTDINGNKVVRTDIARTRQFYLSPDIDFTKIKTRKKWLRVVFGAMNFFKLPAPALMLNNKGKFCAYAFYF